ncbi:MAG: GGDEF domain-containing protein [Pseudomonas sp.]|uniref:GGDEF domain-containing protein n=1 Tax=Pseudomonas sp. TaxID=306 RepID=UPI0030F0F5E6
MIDAELPRSPHTFALWREVQDTRVRTRLGGVYYLLAWLLTWLFSANPSTILLSGIAGSILFAALMVARLVHVPPPLQTRKDLQRWLDRHWALVLLNSLCWGQAHAWALYSDALKDSAMIATLSTVAFSTAMTFNFAMRKKRAFVAILLLYVPGLVVMAMDWRNGHNLLITLLFYLSYLLLALNRSHREYLATLDLELRLLKQQETLDQLSRTDSLTQLGNRYQFNSQFQSMVAHAKRTGEPLALVLLDIDFFKKVNDQRGHAGGDACLSEFAQRMRHVFRRDSDALLRLGGEEFGVLMPDTSLEQAQLLAEQFRQDLAHNGIDLQGEHLPLTASLGVGRLDVLRGEDAENFFKRVDRALYQAKRNGRDRLELAES